MRVLIADDNVDLAQSLAEVLRARSAVVDVFADGISARDRATSHPPDVALLDLKLPERSGLDLIADLMRLPRPPGRIIAMTGYDSPERIAAAERIGAETVLRKPFDLESLVESLGLSKHAEDEPLQDCVLLVLADGATHLRSHCSAVVASDAQDARSKVGDTEFDALVLLGRDATDELITDFGLLDPDLAVVTGDTPALVEGAVRQTRARRAAGIEVALLREALEAVPGATMLVRGAPLRISLWSSEVEALLGYRREELADRPLLSIEQDLVPGPLHELIAAAGPEGIERALCLRVRGGAAREFLVRAAPLHGATLLSLSPAPDGQSQTENLEMLGATAAGVAHELRNTLAGVGNSLSVLAGRLGSEESMRVLGEVQGRVRRAAEVMNDLLDFARPVTLRLMAVPAELVLDAARAQIEAPPGVSVRVHVADPSLRLLVDPVRLQLALINLGNNAAQAMAELGGTVTLSCTAENGEVQLAVADDGPGVPEALHGRIFDPFFTTRSQGSGLGLANVRKLVQAHGGHIRLAPSPRGATFLITLPRRPESAK